MTTVINDILPHPIQNDARDKDVVTHNITCSFIDL